MRPLGSKLVLSVLVLGLAACGGPSLHREEDFNEKTPFWQRYDKTPEEVCDAANLALLSQGYKITNQAARSLIGQKEFQPESELHAILEFQITCRPSPQDAAKTLLFASATESHYALKETSSSAGLSLPKVGSISLPFSSSAESLVKTKSNTIDEASFYQRFHALVNKYLQGGRER
jgi:hypothetical protein